MTDFNECPACGAGLKLHEPENDNDYEIWEFYCGAVIINMEGKHVADGPCGNALRMAMVSQANRVVEK